MDLWQELLCRRGDSTTLVECVVKRFREACFGSLLRGRDGEDADLIVVRKGKAMLSGLHVNRISEQVGIVVRLVQPFGSVLMGCVPCKLRGFDIPSLQAIVIIWLARRDGALLPSLQVCRWPGCVIGGDGPVTL